MSYTFNPTSTELNLLAQVRQRESSGNYSAVAAICNPTCATGAYQFKDSTWQWVSQQTGVGTQYASAGAAPQWMQDANALWLLRYAGGDPNASIAWGASGPYDIGATGNATGNNGSLVDLTGTAATASTTDILDQLDSSASDLLSQAGLDPGYAGLAIAVGIGVLAFVALN